MSECRCPTAEAALACRRAGTPMVRPLWELCQQSPEYRGLWDRLGLSEQSAINAPPSPPAAEKLRTCRFRSRRALRGEDNKPLLRVLV